MLLVFCSIVLFSVIQIQCMDSYHYYCSGDYQSNPSKAFFCQYLKDSNNVNNVPFPTHGECKTCKEFLKRITWNQHTEEAVDNLLEYSSKYFCKKIKRTTKVECKKQLKEYKPKMKEFLITMMKDGKFCEVLLKCSDKKGAMFMSYFSNYKTDSMDFYSMPFFEYFFNLENYSHDFYPYHFFNYFFKYQEHGFPLYSYLERFYENPKNENNMYPYRFFEYFFANETMRPHAFPYRFFEFFDYFFKNHFEGDFYPYKFFDTFFAEENYNYFSKEPKANEKFCKQCENIPASRFLKWAKSVDVKMLTDVGYSTMCSGLKTTEKEKCREMVLRVSNVLRHELENVLTVKTICYKIYRCPMNLPSNTEMYSFFGEIKSNDSIKRCEVCQSVSTVFGSAIDKQLFQDYVVSEFETTYCNQIFPKKESECKEFLKNDLPNLINKIRSMIHKNFLCKSTCRGINTEEVPIEFFEYFFNSNDKRCPACKAISIILKSLVRSSDLKTEVYNKFYGSKCDKLFTSRQKCQTFLDSDYTNIIKNMTEVLEKNQLCKPLCKKQNDEEMSPWISFHGKTETSCQLCEDLVDVLEDFKPSSTTIDNDINRLCLSFSGTKEEYCKRLINQYKTQIKDSIISNRPKDEICRTINQCFTNPKFYGIFDQYL